MEYIFYLFIAVIVVAALSNNAKPKKKYHEKKNYNYQNNYQNQSRLIDANAQLEESLKGGYSRQKIFNRNEGIVYRIILKELKNRNSDLICFAQVSCGEILQNQFKERYNAIGCKRVDFCISDANFNALAVIEYNGTGHALSGDAGIRDATKKNATESAGLIYYSIYHGESYKNKVIELLDRLEGRA